MLVLYTVISAKLSHITLIDDLHVNFLFHLLLFSEYASKGSGGGGTVGELVPSLITAPWRKEQLMLAGDIESNPGPYYTEYGEDLCMVLTYIYLE